MMRSNGKFRRIQRPIAFAGLAACCFADAILLITLNVAFFLNPWGFIQHGMEMLAGLGAMTAFTLIWFLLWRSLQQR